jgi:hypothetical protein
MLPAKKAVFMYFFYSLVKIKIQIKKSIIYLNRGNLPDTKTDVRKP